MATIFRYDDIVGSNIIRVSGDNVCTLNEVHQADINATCINEHSLNSGGSGYVAGDTFTINGTTNPYPASGVVDTVDGTGAVLTYTLNTFGDGYAITTGQTTTGGTGTGLAIDIISLKPWGVVQKDGDYNYTLKCPILITQDVDFRIGFVFHETLTFDYGSNANVYVLQYFGGANGVLRIGRYVNTSSSYLNNYSAHIQSRVSDRLNNRIYMVGQVLVANSLFTNFQYGYLYGSSTQPSEARSTIFSDFHFGLATNFYTSVYDCQFFGGFYGCQFNGADIVDGVLIERCQIGLIHAVTGAGNYYFRNLKMNYITSGTYTYIRRGSNEKKIYFIDSQILGEGLGWYGSIIGTTIQYNEQFLQSTFNFKINNEDGDNLEGVDIKVYNVKEELVHSGTSDINGEDSEVLSYYRKYFTGTATETLEDGQESLEPFKIIISKNGYETVEIKDLEVVSGIPTNIKTTLKKTAPLLIDSNGETHIRFNKENIGDNRELIS